jgi:adenylate cyclase
MLSKMRPGIHALRLAAGCIFLGWIVGIVLSVARPWHLVELKLFDLVTVATAPRKSQLPITIVGIDEASFSKLGKRWPWPRDMHARLIERLRDAGAAVIVFQVVFSEKAPPEEDRAMAEAIKSAGNVVLATDYAIDEMATWSVRRPIELVPEYVSAGAVPGFTSVILDDDGVIRRMPTGEVSLWREVVRTLLRVRPGLLPEPYVADEALIRHLGPPGTFNYVSYYRVLEGDAQIPKDAFADQIVLVGRAVRAAVEAGGATSDTFPTPFLLESKRLTPGVEVQATILENALMGQTLTEAGFWQNLGLLTAALVLALPVLVFWHPVRSGVLMIAVAAVVAGASVWMFTAWQQWYLLGSPAVALAASYLAMGTGSYLTEKKRATQLRSAFSMYVSGELVNEIVARPEMLRLGGQRRELTVLFTDLAGFTSVSEKLEPETVADLINLYLNAVTEVIMRHGGTVDKYVGDAVMAFWNAPLPDPQHALHATQAAVEMQDAMDKLQPRFREHGIEGLKMRVGVHSGPAIVGNMGSDLRFNYTAMGDTVNLASRLEGANKPYGTAILVSASTAAQLQGEIGLRIVDRVRVAGKKIPVDIFTPCGEALLIQATQDAWDAYARRDWDAAEKEWHYVESFAPDDSLVHIYLDRIAQYRRHAPPADWDGSTALEK